jgi:nicotinamide mononucleotide transporter
MRQVLKPVEIIVLVLAGLVLVTCSWQRWIQYPLTETLGFVTGAGCVYLVVREHIWNFPVGIANNVFFFVLFNSSRLYADAWLQVVYLALAIQGWHCWLHGGKDRSVRKIERAPTQVLATVALLVAVGTVGLTLLLRKADGAAPVLDAFTTALSLGAQWLLNRKAIENWYLWIAADVLYIYLYVSRELHLTAVLYAIFLGLCVAGLTAWSQTLAAQPQQDTVVC